MSRTPLTDGERQRLLELQMEVARLREDHNERSTDRALGASHRLYVILGVLMSMVTMVTVAAVYVIRPGDSSLSTTIIGITMPTAIALIGYGLQNNIRGVYHLADGNLSVVQRDLHIALDRIDHLQEVRVDEAQRTIPLVADGATLKVPEMAAGRIVDVKPQTDDKP